MNIKLIIAVAAVFVFSGCAPDGPTTTVAPPAPTATVTHVETREVEVEVPVTPAACKTFIKDSDRLVELSAQALNLASDALTAVSEMDIDGVTEANEKMEKLGPKVTKARTAYERSRSACQSA